MPVLMTEIPLHTEAVIESISLPANQQRRLANHGIRLGTIVSVPRRTAGGSFIIAIGPNRVAVDRATLGGIAAQPVVAQAPSSGHVA